MPRFAANLSMLFTEVPFLQRFSAARAAGFAAVECQFPYAERAEDVAARLRAAALEMVLFNLPAGDVSAGERGIACLPDRVDEFRRGVAAGTEYARTVGCRRMNCLAGIAPPSLARADADRTLIENLTYATGALGAAGIDVVIEAINTRDVPGFYVSTSAQAFALIAAVGSPNLKFQYDVYHMQRMEGELAATLRANVSRIGHVQIADNPGRHEPGTGEINFPYLFEVLDDAGYTGWIGCEYVPANGTVAGLGWAASYQPRRVRMRELADRSCDLLRGRVPSTDDLYGPDGLPQ